MNFGNTCAVACRALLLLLLLYGLVLSSLVALSCQFISAKTHDDVAHGVGLRTFEAESGECVPHNDFVVEHYNGMEDAARICGAVAPTLAALAALWAAVECCRSLWGGKCVPLLLIIGAAVCQGSTFLLFRSELFCDNKDIARCDFGGAGWRSLQACFVYAFSLALYYCGPTPRCAPPSNPAARMKPRASEKKRRGGGGGDDEESSRGSSKKDGQKKGKKKKKKKKYTEPKDGGDWTKEMYEKRRKERKVKGRGVSGRSKEEIARDRGRGDKGADDGGGGGGGENCELALYRPASPGSEGKFDDYVDTEPDGMDWSAYEPHEREAYYERQRSKKRERKERERRKDRGGGRSRGGGGRSHGDSRGSGRHEDSWAEGSVTPSRGGDEYYDERSYRREDSGQYSEDYTHADGGGRDRSYYSRGGGDEYHGDDGDRRSSHGSSYRSRDDRGSSYRSGDDRGYDRGSRGDYDDNDGGRGKDDYDSYAQDDDPSYAQDSYARDDYDRGGDGGDDYGRRSGSRGSSSRRDDDRGYEGSYYDDPSYASYDDRRGGGYRDDPSYA
ncbi:hypothetical protein ACHAWF_018651 [Thalassiosira exigua]